MIRSSLHSSQVAHQAFKNSPLLIHTPGWSRHCEGKVSSSRTQRNVPDQGRRRMVSALDLESSALTMRPLCRDKKFEIETSLSYVMLLIATSCKLRAKRLCSIY